MLTVLFYTSLLPKIGSGPLWKVTVVPESEFCLENWWTNLLYVNNYVHVDRSVRHTTDDDSTLEMDAN
jgi:hypothetical protein